MNKTMPVSQELEIQEVFKDVAVSEVFADDGYTAAKAIIDSPNGLTTRGSTGEYTSWYVHPSYCGLLDFDVEATIEQPSAIDGVFVRFNSDEKAAVIVESVDKVNNAYRKQGSRQFALLVFLTTMLMSFIVKNPFGFSTGEEFKAVIMGGIIAIMFVSFGIPVGIGMIKDRRVSIVLDAELAMTTNDELFFFGKASPVLALLDKGGKFSKLVEPKMLSYPSVDDVNEWCKLVDEILELQPSFTIDLIPVMNIHAITLRDELTVKVADLKQRAIEEKSSRRVVNEISRKSNRDFASEDSAAKLEGALSLVSSMTVEDVFEK